MLHTNASENDLRAWVIKRKISSSTMSADGRMARDVMLGLLEDLPQARAVVLRLSRRPAWTERRSAENSAPRHSRGPSSLRLGPPTAPITMQRKWGRLGGKGLLQTGLRDSIYG